MAHRLLCPVSIAIIWCTKYPNYHWSQLKNLEEDSWFAVNIRAIQIVSVWGLAERAILDSVDSDRRGKLVEPGSENSLRKLKKKVNGQVAYVRRWVRISLLTIFGFQFRNFRNSSSKVHRLVRMVTAPALEDPLL